MKFVYSDYCLNQMQVFALHKEFLERREAAELHNNQRSGQPPTLSTKINVNTVRTLIEENSSLTCLKTVTMDCSKSTIESIMKKFGMWSVASA